MRALLEFLGIAEPEHGRRGPIALPAWSRSAFMFTVPALAIASTIVAAMVRAVVG